jgi:hypothetical protein
MNTPSQLYGSTYRASARISKLKHLHEVYETWLKMRNLLEQHAPSWYPDDLQERVESLVPRIDALATNPSREVVNTNGEEVLTSPDDQVVGAL